MTDSLSLSLSKEKVKTKFLEKTNFSETYENILFYYLGFLLENTLGLYRVGPLTLLFL